MSPAQDDPSDPNLYRIDLLREQTLLASERTFSSWVRSGLAAEAASLAIANFVGRDEGFRTPQAIGVALMLAAGAIYGIALWRYRKAYRRLNAEGLMTATPAWLLSVLIGILLLSVGFAFILLFQV